MKILFLGDQAATGFGTVTKDLGGALIDNGMDVRFVSQNELSEDITEPFKGRTVDLVSLPWVMDTRLGGGARTVNASEALGEVLQGTSQAVLDSGEPTRGWKPDAAIVLGRDLHASVRRCLQEHADIPLRPH
jgi:hypothetical protein